MRDMDRTALRDRLPDLVHGALAAEDATTLEALVATDTELAAELALLRTISSVHGRAPAVDVAAIVRALPPAPTPTATVIDQLAERRASRRPAISMRFARAAALLVVVGGGTVIMLRSRAGGGNTPPIVEAPVESVATATAALQLGLGAPTDELSVDQLKALEEDIRALDGLPSIEPDATTDLSVGEGA